jgi:hypothetical protein
MKATLLSAVFVLLLVNPIFATTVPAAVRRPTQTTLKASFKLPVMSSAGKQIGTVTANSGTVVNIEHVRRQKIMISLGGAKAWVARSSTDFDQRLAAFKLSKQNATAQVQYAKAAQAATFRQQRQDASADFQNQHANYSNPLDQPAYDQTRSVVDYYDWLGRRYHIGAYGQRIYQ